MIRIKAKFAIRILITVTLVVFGRTLAAHFVGWDDDKHILENPYLHPVTLGHTLYFWSHPFLDLYVPLSYTVFALLTLIATRSSSNANPAPTLDPHVFHAANLILHCANVALVYLILRALTQRGNASLIGALLFAVHPLQVESVAWISELRGLLSGFFALLSIFYYIRYIRWMRVANQHAGFFQLREHAVSEGDGEIEGRAGADSKTESPAAGSRNRESTGWDPAKRACAAYGISFAALVLAMLSKPAAAAVPIVVIIIDYWCYRRPLKTAVMAVLPFVVFIVPFVLITQAVQPIPSIVRVPLWQRPFIAGDALAFYIVKLILPIDLITDYGRRPDVVLGTIRPYFEWLFPAAAALVVWLVRRGSPFVVPGALIALAFLLPVLGLTPFVFQAYSTVADRYCYLSLLGVALAVAALLVRFNDKRVYAGAIAVLVVFAALSVNQAGYWATSIKLMSHTIAINPVSGVSYQNLGNALESEGKLPEALADLKRAITLRGDYRIYWKIGVVLTEMGQPTDAIPYYRKALEINPQSADVHYNLGVIYYRLGNNVGALANFAGAVQIDPKQAEARVNMALILIQTRQYASAVSELESGLALRPRNPALHSVLGVALDRMGRPSEAEVQFGEAVGLDPGDIELRLLHGLSLMQIGQAAAGHMELGEAARSIRDPAAFKARVGSAASILGLKLRSSN